MSTLRSKRELIEAEQAYSQLESPNEFESGYLEALRWILGQDSELDEYLDQTPAD